MHAIRSITVDWHDDPDPDLSWIADPGNYVGAPPADVACYLAEDSARLAAYGAGDWSMIGVFAVAEVTVNGTCQTIHSSGLWGIESDSAPDYLLDLEQEQIDDLRTILLTLGFTAKAIDAVL